MSLLKKRGPGRPPSKPPMPSLRLMGIMSNPEDSNNRFEFAYGSPLAFKSMFNYFKQVKATKIHMKCAPTGITFFAYDHAKVSRIVAQFNGTYVHWHYCEEVFWLGLNGDFLEKLFTGIDKCDFKITLIQSYDDLNTLTIIIKDAEIDRDGNYKVAVSTFEPDDELYDTEQLVSEEKLAVLQPIDFVLAAAHLKKTVVHAGYYSETITFEKLGAAPLQIVYSTSNLSYNEVYRDAEKIRLRSSVADDAIFRTTVRLDNIKSLATSQVADYIRIICRDESNDIIFRTADDGGAFAINVVVRTIT